MRKYIGIISALIFVFTVALLGCEKQEPPKPASQPVAIPAAPAPAPVATPPAPAPAPAPAKHYKK